MAVNLLFDLQMKINDWLVASCIDMDLRTCWSSFEISSCSCLRIFITSPIVLLVGHCLALYSIHDEVWTLMASGKLSADGDLVLCFACRTLSQSE